MNSERAKWWKEFGAVIGSISAVATVHALVIVPAILDAAALRARDIAREEASSVRMQLDRHLSEVEAIRQTLVTRGELEHLTRSVDKLAAEVAALRK